MKSGFVSFVGRPNAGKSTLLNRLVGSDRAIVTPIPGTTRDIVRETIEIGGLPVTLADTAGLRDNADPVEEIGIARAREAAERADIILYLVDATADPEPLPYPNALLIFTKIDLVPGSDFFWIRQKAVGICRVEHQLPLNVLLTGQHK